MVSAAEESLYWNRTFYVYDFMVVYIALVKRAQSSVLISKIDSQELRLARYPRPCSGLYLAMTRLPTSS